MATASTDRRRGLTGDKGIKAPVKLATTAEITLSGEQSIDGVTTSSSRVLVKDQSDTSANGIYDTSTAAWTRALDFNGNSDIARGTCVYVTHGTTNAGSFWAVTSDAPTSIGSSAITFGVSVAAGTLATQLATGATGYGANMVAYNPYVVYDDGTVGNELIRLNPLTNYGSLNNNGTTDDSTVFQAAAASGDKFIDARGVNCRVAAAVDIPDNQVWLLHGATLTIASATQTLFNANAVDDWALIGPFKISGDGSTVGTAKAIRISDCSRWLVDAPTISSVRGWGVYVEPGSSTTSRATHGTIRSPVIYSCYYGYEDTPGTGAEYCTIENPRIYGNTAHGLKTSAGNTIVLGGHIVDNTAIGVHLITGSNSGHGIFSGVNINHNGTFGFKAEQVTNGFTFDGCHFYENDLWFDRSKGIHIMGGVVDADLYNYKDGSSGLNVIDGCYCPGDYGIARKIGSNDGHDELVVRNCWGAGVLAASGGKDTAGVSINDPALVYVQVQRDAAATQSLTSATPATITFSSANYLYDRKSVQSSGTFTIPAGQDGLYHIDADLLFSGTGMSVTASYVEMKVGGTTKKVMFPAITSTTTLQVQGSFDYYLNAADAVTFVATITGTDPTFGNATWPSNITLRRIA